MTSSSPAPDLRLAAFALLLASAPARAQEPAPAGDTETAPTSAPEAGEEIIIYGDLEVARRRAELEAAIRDSGYQEGIRRDDRTIFRPEVPWKPTVIVMDEGLLQVTRSPVRWMAPGRSDKPLNNLWCLPPFTPMCVRIGGQVVSKRKLDPQKGRVLTDVHDPTESWRQAIVDKATWERVNQELPGRLEATWREGAPFEPGGPDLPEPAQRREALLRYWATRSDTREGDMVAGVVRDFLVLEVQPSDWPVSREELDRANTLAAGVRVLQFDTAAPLSPPEGTPDPG